MTDSERVGQAPDDAGGELEHWQPLAPMAMVFMAIQAIVRFVRENLYAFIGAGAGVAFLRFLGTREVVLGGALILLVTIGGAVIYHRRFRFRVEADGLRVRSGLFEKKELRVRFARVQNVQLGQPFYFKPFDLVRFSLQTPGAAEKEVELPGIRRALAERLRNRIAALEDVADPAAAESGDEPAESSDVIYEPAAGRLFRHGLASNQVWLLAGFLASVSSPLVERFEDNLSDLAFMRGLGNFLQSSWLAVAGLLLTFLLVLFLISGLLSLIRFHGFLIRDRGDRFIARGGLLDQREQTLKREKLTGLTIRQTAVGRLLGCWYLIGRQATSGENDWQDRQSQFLVPGMRAGDLALADRFLPGSEWNMAPCAPISRHFRRLYMGRVGLSMLLAWTVLWWLAGREWPWLLASGAAIPLVLWLIHRRWKAWGWRLDGDQLWVRQGLFGFRYDTFSLRLVQQASVVQTPYLHRTDLASVVLTMPQGLVTVPFVSLDTARALVNRAIHAAETADAHRV